MNAELFAADLAGKPDLLTHLATVLEGGDPWLELGRLEGKHVVLVGMGSSHYASSVVAARLRAGGVHAVAELAGSDLLPRVGPGSVVVAVSATGESRETIDAVARLGHRAPVIALTNQPKSTLAQHADLVVAMEAGEERGGVACRTYTATLAMLLALQVRLVPDVAHDLPRLLRAAATASADLLDCSDQWLPRITELLVGSDGTHIVAPARRLSSAQQSALMLREGPRRAAVGCETSDWSHVDVYLTKTTDYRLLLLAGSRWEDELLRWTTERGTTVVTVGGHVEGSTASVRYPGDGDDDVRLLTETLVTELVAADLWRRQT